MLQEIFDGLGLFASYINNEELLNKFMIPYKKLMDYMKANPVENRVMTNEVLGGGHLTDKEMRTISTRIDPAFYDIELVQARVSTKTANWIKEKPTTPCVFVTRVWNNHLKIYDYNIWRLITTNGESLESPTYLGWYTEGGDEWDDYSDCNFDEYKIIGEV